MRKLVQWGAGNIGRSFIGQIFARSGWEVVFVDIDEQLIALLNRDHRYQVQVVSQEGEQMLEITGVSAVHGSRQQQINALVTEADVLSVSVGKQVLPRIAPQLAEALEVRYQKKPDEPVNLIIGENIHHGAEYMSRLLSSHLPETFPLSSYVGLAETSIGKMVPLQTGDDPLVIRAEPHNTLYVDREAFIGAIPECRFLEPVAPMEAYVERKLYIHNLGHAAAAYLGYALLPEKPLLAEVLSHPQVMEGTRRAMEQAAEVLLKRYPSVFTREGLQEHIEDLLYRFQNRALGDTVYRVGRDLGRKLRYDDRVTGAILMAAAYGLKWDALARVFAAGLRFRAADPEGRLYEPDTRLIKQLKDMSVKEMIRTVSGLEVSGASAEMQEHIVDEIAQYDKEGAG